MGWSERSAGRRILPAILAGMCLAGAQGCAGRSPGVRMDPDDALAVAKRAYERGKCLQAIGDLENLVLNHPGSAEAGEAQFLLGECHRRIEQYDLARSAYQDLIREYPKSEFRDDAQLMIGVSYYDESLPPEYDQEMTWKAVEEFEVFLTEYPESPLWQEAEAWLGRCRDKIAEKQYLNGELYLKMGYTRAARLTLEQVAHDYPSSKWSARAILGVAKTYLREKNVEEAEAALGRLIEEYPGTPEALKGQEALRELKEADSPRG